jgi:hypothetical protein
MFKSEEATFEEIQVTDALSYLRSIYLNPMEPTNTRLKAAGIAIEYERPRLAVTAIVNGQDFATKLDRAVARSTAVSNGTKVIAPPKVKSIADEIDLIEPIVTIPDRRYRR